MKLDTQNIIRISKDFQSFPEDSHHSNMQDNTPINTKFKITEADQEDLTVIKNSNVQSQSNQY